MRINLCSVCPSGINTSTALLFHYHVMSIVIPVLLMQLWAHDIKVDAQFETEAQKGIKIRSNYCLKVVNIITRLKLHLARVGGVPNEAVIVQKNLHLDEKAFKQFREKLKAQEEQYRKIQETTNHQHNEKVQEVEEKNYELEILGDQPEVKEKELLSKDDEMDRLRERAIEVSPHIESSESDTTVHDTEPQISESSCSSDSDEDVGEQNEVDSPESVCFTSPDGVKFWTPICEDNELLNDQIFEVFFFLTTYVLFLSELMDY
ncbi:hypothetical protein DCAR_0520260 [Daucus carota subsp. sativus]|uniref:Uncharacterized protein n=1 Tax=Daucus carota subsp. sativus TaxID=79200 RepID=A0AAF0X5N4_DAUCS|nr:hypothetical protein DCAR_0520260 [Daucus carota subsp. sativus]